MNKTVNNISILQSCSESLIDQSKKTVNSFTVYFIYKLSRKQQELKIFNVLMFSLVLHSEPASSQNQVRGVGTLPPLNASSFNSTYHATIRLAAMIEQQNAGDLSVFKVSERGFEPGTSRFKCNCSTMVPQKLLEKVRPWHILLFDL